jgi:hypothetical protein
VKLFIFSDIHNDWKVLVRLLAIADLVQKLRSIHSTTTGSAAGVPKPTGCGW